MSIKSWQDKYWIEPSKDMCPIDACKTSLLKWRGLLRKNLRKHNVKWGGNYVIDDEGKSLCVLGHHGCGLCVVHHNCEECPLYAVLNEVRCDDPITGEKSLYTDAKTSNKGVKEIIKQLERALYFEMGRQA